MPKVVVFPLQLGRFRLNKSFDNGTLDGDYVYLKQKMRCWNDWFISLGLKTSLILCGLMILWFWNGNQPNPNTIVRKMPLIDSFMLWRCFIGLNIQSFLSVCIITCLYCEQHVLCVRLYESKMTERKMLFQGILACSNLLHLSLSCGSLCWVNTAQVHVGMLCFQLRDEPPAAAPGTGPCLGTAA